MKDIVLRPYTQTAYKIFFPLSLGNRYWNIKYLEKLDFKVTKRVMKNIHILEFNEAMKQGGDRQ